MNFEFVKSFLANNIATLTTIIIAAITGGLFVGKKFSSKNPSLKSKRKDVLTNSNVQSFTTLYCQINLNIYMEHNFI